MKKILFSAVAAALLISCTACAKEKNDGVPDLKNDKAPHETLLVDNTPNPAAEFEIEEIDGNIKIKSYIGNGINVIIPETINEKTVVAIGPKAFADNLMLEQIYVGEKITDIAVTAFDGSENVIIVTKAGAAAHDFAAQNQIKYNLY